ncbi:hypothetical protein OVY29_17705 [Sphingopyxis sp. SE2]|uniref:hypothetical protein n=1 Tax=Sphingopyxis sp. SE2 TaxID=1586240 RepID=UPI0028BF638C|nr:hypothetical protein [Sphingopyxis sp. SE2]MDT7530499.1 hypothetical protein [Sphingopyxis sp. SE2]
MEPTPPPAQLLAGTCLAFHPVPQQRRRADGWTPIMQQCFIRALEAMGSVGQAARAVGMGRRSAYRLRDRPGAESFAQAWDRAISMGGCGSSIMRWIARSTASPPSGCCVAVRST